MLRRPCADSVATFVESFDEPPDAGHSSMEYIRLTPEEIERRFPSHTQDAGTATAPEPLDAAR
jgi:hypothetical protein